MTETEVKMTYKGQTEQKSNKNLWLRATLPIEFFHNDDSLALWIFVIIFLKWDLERSLSFT